MKIINKKETKQSLPDKTQESVKTVQKPQVCCLDLTDKDIDTLKKDGINIYQGTLGEKIIVPNYAEYKEHQLHLNHNFPPNVHEYDIFILNLHNSRTIAYKSDSHIRKNITGMSYLALRSSYPETLFDPRPFSSFLLKSELHKIRNRRCLIIVFTTGEYDVDYEPINISSDRVRGMDVVSYNIYSLFDYIPLSHSIFGKEMKTLSMRNDLQVLLNKHIDSAVYNQTFNHPTSLENNKRVKDKKFFPLLVNQNEDIISYYNDSNHFDLLILPQFKNKGVFLSEFLKVIAPSISPELFPFSTQYLWKKDKEYWLPNEGKLELERKKVEKKYEQELEIIDKKTTQNKTEYAFLHEILTETGDALVDSLMNYLKWLGFTKIRDMDKENEKLQIKEEDLQIEIDTGLLIIEVKGIGGTSTDSECSQISKIKHRRCEERGAFDVFALYLVNHQRYMPPLKRKNPPFTMDQIRDAKNDKRGLLTTWQLFNIYFDIQNGILTKEEARNKFIEFGFVEFTPENLILIDTPKEFFKNGLVCIVNLDSIKLKVGEDLIVEKNGRYLKSKIKEIMKDDKHVDEASSGEFGLELSEPIKKKSKLWKNSSK
ncbi:MAG: hypothetical protein ACUZ8N_14335 [Candidatus Scalindua sp.]